MTDGLSYLPVVDTGSFHSWAASVLNLQVQSFAPGSPHLCYPGTSQVGNSRAEQGHPYWLQYPRRTLMAAAVVSGCLQVTSSMWAPSGRKWEVCSWIIAHSRSMLRREYCNVHYIEVLGNWMEVPTFFRALTWSGEMFILILPWPHLNPQTSEA